MRLSRVAMVFMVILLLLYPSSCGQRKESPPPSKSDEQGKSKGYMIYINEDTPKKYVMYSVDIEGKNKKKVYDKNPVDAAGYEGDIAFVESVSNKKALSTIKGDGSGLTPVMTNTPLGIGSLAWSSDGKKIAFTAKPDEASPPQVFYVEAGKFKTPVVVTKDAFVNKSPAFSNDSKFLIYSKEIGGSSDICKYEISSRNEINLSNNSADDISPIITPDGTKILFLSDEAEKGKYNLYLMDIDGAGRTALTTGMNIEDGSLDVSPDSSMIAFVTLSDKGNKAVHVIDMHKSIVMVANGGYMTSWSGDSEMLYYASSDPKNRRIVEYSILDGSMKDILNIPYKPGEESEGIKLLHFTDKLK